MEEIWKTIEEAPNYSISNLGRVKNNKLSRLAYIWSSHGMYKHVYLTDNGRSFRRYIDDLMKAYFG